MLRVLAPVVVSCALVSAASGQSESQGDSPEQDVLRVGFSVATFMDVNPQDAQAAIRTFSKLIARKKGLDTTFETLVFQDLSEIREALASNRLDIATLMGYEYLQIAEHVPLDPVAVPSRDGSVYGAFVLLVPRDRAEQRLQDLRGQDILISVSQKNALPYRWLDVMLLREGLPESEDFFASIEEVIKPSKAVFPVFFGQADACVTTESSFQTMLELNPQLGQQLVVLRSAPGFLRSVMVFNGQRDIRNEELLREAIMELHSTPEGEQILSIFRVQEQLPFRPEYLEGTKALLAEYEQLRKGRGK